MPVYSTTHHSLSGLGMTMGIKIIRFSTQHQLTSPGHAPSEETGGCELQGRAWVGLFTALSPEPRIHYLLRK